MKTELQESMTAGVFVEYQDACGNTVGQAVFTAWHGRPVPAVGDSLRCAVRSSTTGRRQTMVGRVVSRHFELQYEDDEPCVWARLVVRTIPANAPQPPVSGPLRFSTN